MKNCKFYDVLLEYCVDVVPGDRIVPNEELSTDIPPMKRNAPDSVSEIYVSQFCAAENEFVQNDAPDSEREIRKKRKSMESEENSAMEVVNACCR